jgi:hypothetical protein
MSDFYTILFSSHPDLAKTRVWDLTAVAIMTSLVTNVEKFVDSNDPMPAFNEGEALFLKVLAAGNKSSEFSQGVEDFKKKVDAYVELRNRTITQAQGDPSMEKDAHFVEISSIIHSKDDISHMATAYGGVTKATATLIPKVSARFREAKAKFDALGEKVGNVPDAAVSNELTSLAMYMAKLIHALHDDTTGVRRTLSEIKPSVSALAATVAAARTALNTIVT